MKDPAFMKIGKFIHRSRLACAERLPDSANGKLAALYEQNIRKFPKDGSVNDL